MKRFKSGAKRSELKPTYDLIPREALKRLALRYSLGERNYGLNNWQKGVDDPDFIRQAFNHIIDHLYTGAAEGSHRDDHFAAAARGCFALIWFEENGRGFNRKRSLVDFARFGGKPLRSKLPRHSRKVRKVLRGDVSET